MMQFDEKDFEFLQNEAKKRGFEIIKKEDIPEGEESNYIDLSTINIFEAICIPYDYSELEKFDIFTTSRIGQAA